MNEPNPVFSTIRAIQDEHVTFVVDANILLEFKVLGQIDWALLCPRAKSIRLVVPTTVVHEMDQHKKSTGRLRRRALEFNRILSQIEDGDGVTALLDHNRIELRIMLMPRYSRSELSQDKLSFEIADDLIVAETMKFNQDREVAIFLADDNNARRTAREMGVPVARPAEEWRRHEPRDKRDARIEELERQIGAMPKLSLSLLTEKENAVIFKPIYEYEIPYEFCERLANIILERNPGLSREELLRRHKLEDAHGTTRGLRLTSLYAVTVTDVERYCRDYDEFKNGVISWSRKIPNVLAELQFVAPLHVEIANSGEAFAEDIEVELTVSNGFSFVPNRFVQSYLEMDYKSPDPPSRMGHLSRLPTLLDHQRLSRRDPFSFYFGDSPDDDALVCRISYECDRFRHGTANVLQSTLMKRSDAPLGGQLTVKASSASLAEAIEARCPIKVNPEGPSVDFRDYLRPRLSFFPEQLREAVLEALEAA